MVEPIAVFDVRFLLALLPRPVEQYQLERPRGLERPEELGPASLPDARRDVSLGAESGISRSGGREIESGSKMVDTMTQDTYVHRSASESCFGRSTNARPHGGGGGEKRSGAECGDGTERNCGHPRDKSGSSVGAERPDERNERDGKETVLSSTPRREMSDQNDDQLFGAWSETGTVIGIENCLVLENGTDVPRELWPYV